MQAAMNRRVQTTGNQGANGRFAMEIGEPETEREIEIFPLEEPVPDAVPVEVPAEELEPA